MKYFLQAIGMLILSVVLMSAWGFLGITLCMNDSVFNGLLSMAVGAILFIIFIQKGAYFMDKSAESARAHRIEIRRKMDEDIKEFIREYEESQKTNKSSHTSDED
jgi:hypothetical protein